jgi:hypothetical protein
VNTKVEITTMNENISRKRIQPFIWFIIHPVCPIIHVILFLSSRCYASTVKVKSPPNEVLLFIYLHSVMVFLYK